jgi:uncharacterized membrane protein (UPF0127 family)
MHICHRSLRYIPIFVLLFVAACGRQDDQALQSFNTRPVTLPNGTKIRAEVMIREEDMRRGMMFRKTFPEGHGMLFIHAQPGKYSYWMYQVELPIDIVWLDARKQVVEIVESAQPCRTKASECPQLGGTQDAASVLELPAGYARKHGVSVGSAINY